MKSKSLVHPMRSPDYWLISIVLALILLGAFLIYSASSGHIYVNAGPARVLVQHLIRLAIGGVALYAASQFDYHTWQRWPLPLVIAGGAVAMLVALRIMSQGASDTTSVRWFFANRLGESVQPSEMAKLAAIIYMAAWLASKGENIRRFSYGFLPFILLVGFMTSLILAQPDLSTAMIIGSTAVIMFFIGGADMKQLLMLFAMAVAGAPLIVRKQYMLDRINSWYHMLTNPSEIDLAGLNYQPFETTTALAAGGITGVGLGGSQHKIYFGAMAHTDLIMAVAGEELGLLGSLLILALFAAFAYRGIKIAMEAPDSFGSLLAVGITFWIIVQALIHAAVVSQLMPVTGMPLPFISYGGSALVMEMIGVGLLLNISKQGSEEGSQENARLALGRGYRRPRLPRAHHS